MVVRRAPVFANSSEYSWLMKIAGPFIRFQDQAINEPWRYFRRTLVIWDFYWAFNSLSFTYKDVPFTGSIYEKTTVSVVEHGAFRFFVRVPSSCQNLSDNVLLRHFRNPRIVFRENWTRRRCFSFIRRRWPTNVFNAGGRRNAARQSYGTVRIKKTDLNGIICPNFISARKRPGRLSVRYAFITNSDRYLRIPTFRSTK